MELFWLDQKEEQPLDKLVADGGFCGIFRRIGCVGDSLSSGEYEIIDEDGTSHYHDIYECSWGQFISYITGSKVYNFSKGGMSAKRYNETFAEENDFWNPRKACQAYIIALGVNDLFGCRQEVGSLEDICMEDWRKNRETFAGEYGKNLQRSKEIQPDPKFFLVTMPHEVFHHDIELKNHLADQHAELLRNMAEAFSNTYVIDLRKYGPCYDEAFKEQFYYNGHMNACGYQLTAKMIMSYIDYLIRHHMKEFSLAGMIGQGYPLPKDRAENA